MNTVANSEQRLAALDRAHAARRERASTLAFARLDACFAADAIRNPRPADEVLRLFPLIDAALYPRHAREAHLRRICRAAGVDSSLRLGQLTQRQRDVLCDELREALG